MYLWKNVSARRKLSSTNTELLYAQSWERRRMRTEMVLKAQMLPRTRTETLTADPCDALILQSD